MDSKRQDEKQVKNSDSATSRLDDAIERGDQSPPSLLKYEAWLAEEK